MDLQYNKHLTDKPHSTAHQRIRHPLHPLGFGGGKVWKSGDNVLNTFIEPQWTVERSGNGQPQFTLLAGLNVTFGK